MTLREIIFYIIGAMGIQAYVFVANQLLYATSGGLISGYLTGSVMGISPNEFYIFTVIATICSYAFIFMNPINVLIFENHGRLNKKTAIFAASFWSLQILVGIGLYFVPSAYFEGIIKGLPQLIANVLVSGGVCSLLNWFIRYKFSEKYGRMKPFFIVYNIPILILSCAIPYVPVDASHTFKLVVLHLLACFLANFQVTYINYQGLVQLLSPNSLERQRVLSYGALPIGLMSSIFSTLLPIIVGTTGGYLNIRTYRIFVPILTVIAVGLSMFMLPVKERIIENTKNRVEVKFFKAAKQVLSNKYWWITNISNAFGQWISPVFNVMNFFFIYSIRQEWLMGIASALVSLVTSNISKLLVPTLIKRFEKQKLMIVSRFCTMIFIGLYIIAVKMESVWLLILFNMGRNFFENIYSQVNAGLNADILDYHQWKTGERADMSSTIFSWFMGPVIMVMGYAIPEVLANQGYTSNWDVLFDSSIFANVMNTYIIFAVIGSVLSIIPLFFYNLSREMHDKCIREMEERVKAEMSQETAAE